MSNFLVSARKYRPDHFNSVVGQQHITKTLKTAIKNDQVAQAYLFTGPRGVGKTSCARILAQTLNCTNRTADVESCDVCESCVSFKTGTSFNVRELDAASNNTVEDIRGLVEQLRYAPQAGKYKIYIIDEVHMLSTSAFNAFLKTLEEPPSYAIFILATTEKHKIIPTILSRCQIFDFHRIQVKDIAQHLEHIARQEGIAFEPEAMHMIAQKADGALRDALSSFDQLSIYTDNNITYSSVITNLNILDYEYYFGVTEKILKEDIAGSLILFDDILRNGFNGNDFLNGLNSHFRDLLISKDEQTLYLLEVSEQARHKYALQSRQCTQSFLLSAMAIGSQAEINYRTSKNQRLQVELALMKMCHIAAAFRVRSGEKKNSEVLGDDDDVDDRVSFGEELLEAGKPQSVPPKATPEAQLSIPAQRIASTSIKIRLPKAGDISYQAKPETTDTLVIEEPDERQLDLGEVVSAYNDYAKSFSEDSRVNVHNLLAAYPPRLDGVKSVVVLVENSIQRDILQPELGDLQAFLKQKLDQRSLSVKIEVLEPKEHKKKVMFSSYDHFMYLAEKNPYLLEFKTRLELDLER